MIRWYQNRAEKAIGDMVGGGAMLVDVLEALYAIQEKVGEYIEGIEQDLRIAKETEGLAKEKSND